MIMLNKIQTGDEVDNEEFSVFVKMSLDLILKLQRMLSIDGSSRVIAWMFLVFNCKGNKYLHNCT